MAASRSFPARARRLVSLATTSVTRLPGFTTLLHFSFVPQTTPGYGDVAPRGERARGLVR
jgi:hypothetical protein